MRKRNVFYEKDHYSDCRSFNDSNCCACVFDSAVDYYMNDPDCLYQEIVPGLVLIEDGESITVAHDLTDEECEAYQIELISWKLSEPITNRFE